MNLFVVDTHALYWYFTQPSKLGVKALDAFQLGEQGDALLYVPAIVLAELYYLNRKLGIQIDFNQVYDKLEASSQFIMLPLMPGDMLMFSQNQLVPELHDRIIVGVAGQLNAPCITVDKAIIQSGLVKVIWS